ncbi:ATP-binding cassette domain-containing protein, partial [Acinetobacter baumannii]
GSGKTSLLRAVAGLEPAQSGRIRLDGALLEGDGVRVPAEARRIGMVFQDFALFPHLDVAANIGFGLRGMARAQREQI